MHSFFAEIKEAGKVVWGDKEKGNRSIVLHFLVAALDGIGIPLSRILKRLGIIEAIVVLPLTDRKQNAHSLSVIVLDCLLEHTAPEIAPATTGIAQTYPWNTLIIYFGIAFNAQYLTSIPHHG